MVQDGVAVFFYGLFMDKSLLASKGIVPSIATAAYVDGHRLRIGDRATLVPDPDGRAYGVLMTIRSDETASLYSDETVADYVPESVSVKLQGGVVRQAICYNLPPRELGGVNRAYADALLLLATKLGFPKEYLDHIRTEGRGL
jgi:AIG2-like family